jgi:hypothetical protein
VEQFAVRHSRLPCPARTVDGPEDCSHGFKGWLPTATLTAVAGGGGPMAMRYLVYRGDGHPLGTGPDLAGPVADARRPLLADGSDAGVADHRTGLDFCEALRWRKTGRWAQDDSDQLVSTNVAYVQAGSRASTVAFALAIAPVPGQESASPRVNADLSSASFEIGAATNAAADLVRFTTLGELSTTLACGTAALALDTLAVGSSWAAAADSRRAANIQAGRDTGDIVAAIFVGADGMGVFESKQDIVIAKSTIVTSHAEIIALLPWSSNPIVAKRIATLEAAIATATTGLFFAHIDLPKNIISLTASSAYLAAYKIVAAQAKAIPVWHGGEQWLDSADRAGPVMTGDQ